MSHSIVVFDDKNRVVLTAENVKEVAISDSYTPPVSAKLTVTMLKDKAGTVYQTTVYDD